MDCRPLLGAMGLQDMRSGQALLNAGKSDFRSFKMSTLVQSKQGRAFLEHFAGVIETAMTPVFAGIICVCIYICTCVCVHMCLCGGEYIHECTVCTYVQCVYTYVCMYTYVYVCMYEKKCKLYVCVYHWNTHSHT